MKNACCACRSNWQSITIIDELGFVPLSKTGAELLFEVFSQRYERGSILVTSNLPFDEWTEIFGSEHQARAGGHGPQPDLVLGYHPAPGCTRR